MSKIQFNHSFEEIISVENLLSAWKEFECGKKGRKDVQEFSINLMDNIFLLHGELSNHSLQSYLGMLRYCNGYEVRKEIKNLF